MTTFIRQHGSYSSPDATASTTAAVSLAADVPAGRTLIAILSGAHDGASYTPTGLSRPVGETAAWTRVAMTDQYDPTYGRHTNASVWSIRPTIKWYKGQSIAATWPVAFGYQTLAISEWDALGATLVGAPDYAASASNNPSLSVSVNGLNAGDVFVTGEHMSTRSTFGGGVAYEGKSGSALLEVTPSWSGSERPGAPPDQATMLVWRASLVATSGDSTALWSGSAGADGNPRAAFALAFVSDNHPPNAPTLTTLTAGGTINRANTNRLAWNFSDPDAGDTQSQAEVRYRQTGTTAWTTVTVSSPSQFWDAPGGTFTAGDYEWQARTWDSLGTVGPWSSSGFFTAADQPPGPTITYPTNGQTVEQVERVTWSTPAQDAYRLRRVADDGTGQPDTSTVYFDTGEVTDTTTRGLVLDFATNQRTEHIQLQVENDNLWSPWVTVAVVVSYTPPPTPAWTMSLDPATASLAVFITNPPPAADAPATSFNQVLIDDGEGFEVKKGAEAIPTNGAFRYWTPRGGRDYSNSILVRAYASNGVTADSQ